MASGKKICGLCDQEIEIGEPVSTTDVGIVHLGCAFEDDDRSHEDIDMF